MKKSLKVIGIVICINIILIALASIWAKGLKEDQKKTKEKMNIILKAYPKFDESVNQFSDNRNILYENKEEMYYETLSENADYWNDFIAKYAECIKNLEENAKVLKENCTIKYGDVNTNSKCTAFKANYEAAHNYYISDAKSFNKIIDEYNSWREKNDKDAETINKFSYPVHGDYIDYDEDGEFFGKSEVSKNE